MLKMVILTHVEETNSTKLKIQYVDFQAIHFDLSRKIDWSFQKIMWFYGEYIIFTEQGFAVVFYCQQNYN